MRDIFDPTQPAAWTSAVEKQKVWDANELVRFTLCCILAGFRAGGFFVLENPEKSQLWELEEVRKVLKALQAVKVLTHYCRWLSEDELIDNCVWLKPTVLAGDLPGLSELGLLCQPRRWCQRWRRPHKALVGKRDGVFWTRLAEPYPRGLCMAVAHLFRAALDHLPRAKAAASTTAV